MFVFLFYGVHIVYTLCVHFTGTNTNEFNVYCNVSNICKIKCLSSNACSNLHLHCYDAATCFVDCDETNGINCPVNDGAYMYGIWTTVTPTNQPSKVPSDQPTYVQAQFQH